MFNNDDYDLTADERAAIAALPREMEPSDLLEERVVRGLRNEGHFVASPGRKWSGAILKIAAAIALFAGGVATDRLISAEKPAAEPVMHEASSVRQLPPETNTTKSVKHNETVVAEREMWL
jgi:hypothetical protein